MTVRPSVRPSAQRASNVKSHTYGWCENLQPDNAHPCGDQLTAVKNRVSADQYHMTVSRAQIPTYRGCVFFWSYPLISYYLSTDAGSTPSGFTSNTCSYKFIVWSKSKIYQRELGLQPWQNVHIILFLLSPPYSFSRTLSGWKVAEKCPGMVSVPTFWCKNAGLA